MTQLERLKRRIPEEPDDGVLEDALESAKNVILSRRFPYGHWPTQTSTNEYGQLEETTVLEPRYRDLQIRVAVDLYNKRGAEGELGHTENGISRSYESSWVSQELLNEVVPMVGVVG